jgi:dCTP deaminase
MDQVVTLLGNDDLREFMKCPDITKRLVVTPLLDDSQIGEASIDLRLGTDFLFLKRTAHAGVDPGSTDIQRQANEIVERETVPFGQPLWLHPRQFVLGATLEFIRLPASLGAYVLGRSSWGRIGLIVATAVMVQPGFTGSLTLELVNEGESPIALYPGARIAQLAVHSLAQPTTLAYGSSGSKYVAPTEPQASRLDKEQQEIERIRRLGWALINGEGTPP